ncbi:MAG: hypothetical protein LBD78_04100 [Spirochaetaceae bacterium]|jgi:hypothetical protein|nr:hypothetical protein [Spirochaetaceae bacterium]
MSERVEAGVEKEEEVLITRISIINRNPSPLSVAQKYRCLFHGSGEIKYGRYSFRYPVTHTGYQRLVTAFINDHPNLRVDVGASGIETV